MSDEQENVDDGVDKLNEELGITDAKKDIIEDPEKETQETSEADLAQKALEESSESAESAESDEDRVPLSKYMAEKNKRRDVELENAELRGRQTERDSVQSASQSTSTAKSPIQLEMESQGVETEEELDLTSGETMKLMRKEQTFETSQADSKTASDTAQTVKRTQTESCNAAKDTYADEGLEFGSIVGEGEKLLTKGEALDISESRDNYGKVAYEKCLHAIIRKGGDRAKEIQKLIDANNTNEQSDEEAKKKAEEEKAVKAKASGKFDLEKDLASEDGTGSEAEQKPNKRLLDFMESKDT